MAATPHTLGPGHVYVRFRGNTEGNYVGTAEVAPVIEVEQPKLMVMNDLAGRTYPFQKVEDGERHTYTVVLNKFDYAVWKGVRDTYYHQLSIINHGSDDRFKRGSLHMGIGDFQLIHVHDFTGVLPAHPLAQVDEPVGRLYCSAELVGYKEDPSANRVQTIAAVFRCDALYDSSTRRFNLYTEVAANFGLLTPIT